MKTFVDLAWCFEGYEVGEEIFVGGKTIEMFGIIPKEGTKVKIMNPSLWVFVEEDTQGGRGGGWWLERIE